MFMADLYRIIPDDLGITPLPITGNEMQAKEITRRLLASSFGNAHDQSLQPLRARLRQVEDNQTISEFEMAPGGVSERMPSSLS